MKSPALPVKKNIDRSGTGFSKQSDDSKASKSPLSRTSSWFHKMRRSNSIGDNPDIFVYNIAHKQTMTMPRKELMHKVGDNPEKYQTVPISASNVPIYLGKGDNEHREWFASVHIPASIRVQRLLRNNCSFDELYVTSF